MNPSLANFAAEAVSAYISECGALVVPTLAGLLSVEYANVRTWTSGGYLWEEVREALKAVWAAQPAK